MIRTLARFVRWVVRDALLRYKPPPQRPSPRAARMQHMDTTTGIVRDLSSDGDGSDVD